MISFDCPHCGYTINVAAGLAGRKGKCAKCGQAVTVPNVSAVPSKAARTADSSFDDIVADIGSDPGDPLESLGLDASADTASQMAAKPAAARGLEACPDCTGLVSLRAAVCPHCGCPIRSRPCNVEQRYRMLRVLSTGYFFGGLLSIAFAGLCSVGFVATLVAEQYETALPLAAAAFALVASSFTSFALAEGIVVFLEIEAHARWLRDAFGGAPSRP